MTPLAALAALLLGASPFTAEQPQVQEGNEKLLSGDGAAALKHYDAAEKAAGPHPEIDFDRGDALQAQGKHAEAGEAWKKALERAPKGPLASRALQNQGNALDAAGDRDGAIRAFSEALAHDPGNEDARYNLEVLLRRKASGKGKPKDPGQEGPKPQPGPDQPGAGQKPRPGEDQRPEPRPGEPPRAPAGGKDEAQRAGEAGDRAKGPQGQAGQRRPEELDRQDAERLLDALRARERNMPMDPTPRKDARRRDVEKDW
jgi:Ca-activated chloride channel family protein